MPIYLLALLPLAIAACSGGSSGTPPASLVPVAFSEPTERPPADPIENADTESASDTPTVNSEPENPFDVVLDEPDTVEETPQAALADDDQSSTEAVAREPRPEPQQAPTEPVPLPAAEDPLEPVVEPQDSVDEPVESGLILDGITVREIFDTDPNGPFYSPTLTLRAENDLDVEILYVGCNIEVYNGDSLISEYDIEFDDVPIPPGGFDDFTIDLTDIEPLIYEFITWVCLHTEALS